VSRRIPTGLNIVRFTGFGGGAFVRTPKGFERADVLEGDHQHYAVRKGFRLARCPGAHGFDRGCERCLPYHGAIAQPIRLRHAGSGRPNLATVLGLRRCYRTENYFHGADDPECDCLRAELPIEARAMSSGALGTPDRDTECEECGGSGKTLEWFGFSCSERRCQSCSGRGGISPAAGRAAKGQVRT